MQKMNTNFLSVFCLLVCIAEAKNEYKLFNVLNYGARADDRTDNTMAFLKAWSDACRWRGKSTVLIPQGSYMLNEVIFSGPCNSWMNFQIEGRLKAPSDIYSFKTDSWISFRYVNNLYVGGGGTLDGQGAVAWAKNDCQKNRNCRVLPGTMTFQFITNGYIHHMRSINSKQNHFTLYGCKNMVLTKLKLIAPFNSPNTDGIKIALSMGITITSVSIGTGDDCIAMLYGTKGVRISDVFCGPGHGISIGSLGKNNGEEDVDDIVVKNCTFSGTNNGVRIKTWSSILQTTTHVSNIHYEDIVMDKVQNPIIIDQNYCPSLPCNAKGEVSSVQISNVSYKYIRGSGNADVAASLQCSPNKPCQNITMENINLWPSGRSRKLNNECLHVIGASYGTQIPHACI